MPTPLLPHWPATLDQYTISQHGRVMVHEGTTSFGFQMRVENVDVRPSLVFALTTNKINDLGQFAVHIDLTTGEISDIANKTGVIGWLEQDIYEAIDESHPLMLRWEVEHIGGALIPRLQIGDEEWLYPSVLFSGKAKYTAVAGYHTPLNHAGSMFSPTYVWCQDRLSK